jgi:hypothetical protein
MVSAQALSSTISNAVGTSPAADGFSTPTRPDPDYGRPFPSCLLRSRRKCEMALPKRPTRAVGAWPSSSPNDLDMRYWAAAARADKAALAEGLDQATACDQLHRNDRARTAYVGHLYERIPEIPSSTTWLSTRQ